MPNPVPVLLCARSGVRKKIPFCFQVTAADSLEGIWLCKGSALRCAPSSWYFGFQCRNPEIHGVNECVPAPSSSSPSPRPLLRLQRVGEVRIREKARRRGVTCHVYISFCIIMLWAATSHVAACPAGGCVPEPRAGKVRSSPGSVTFAVTPRRV